MQVKACDICGKRTARYVCQECGRCVCETCLEPRTWVCSDCYIHLKGEAPAPEYAPWPTSFKLFLAGFFLVLAGTIFVVAATIVFRATTSFGAMVFVGPIPIILGAGPHSLWVITLALALTVLGVILFVLLRKRA